MTAPNIIGATAIYGGTAVQLVSTTTTAILTNGTDTNISYKINALIISNVHGELSSDITVDLYRSGVAYRIVSTINVPAETSFTPIDKSISLYLIEGDSLRLTSSDNDRLQAVCSYEEVVG